jgi:hypothetical protein
VILIVFAWTFCRAAFLNLLTDHVNSPAELAFPRNPSAKLSFNASRSKPLSLDRRSSKTPKTIKVAKPLGLRKNDLAFTVQRSSSLTDVSGAKELTAKSGSQPMRRTELSLLSRSVETRAKHASDVNLSPPFSPIKKTPFSKSDQWSISGWLLARSAESQSGFATNGSLGGSQIGVRLQRKLLQSADGTSLSLNFRVSAPLSTKIGAEGAIGVSIRTATKQPIDFIVERRIPFGKDGRSDFAAIVATGFDDVPIGRGLLASAYGQSGIVGFSQPDFFVNGAARLEHDLIPKSRLKIRLGAGVWGAAQPGLSRLDVGPLVSVRFPIAKTNMRVSAEWRQRIAGNADPASGPALTIGTDF